MRKFSVLLSLLPLIFAAAEDDIRIGVNLSRFQDRFRVPGKNQTDSAAIDAMMSEMRISSRDSGENSVHVKAGVLAEHASFLVNRVLLSVGKNYYLPANTGSLKRNYYHYIYQAALSGNGVSSAPFKYLAYLVYNIDRSPENIRTIYNALQPLLAAIVAVEKYRSTPLNMYVRDLLQAHHDLTRTDAYKTVFYTISGELKKKRDANGYCTALQCGKYWNDFISAGMRKRHTSPCEETADGEYADYCPNRNLYWFYSFWYRRHFEGNMEAVHEILSGIDAYYSGQR